MNERLQSLRLKALAVGIVGTGATIASWFVIGPDQFFQSWLAGFMYVFAFASGGLGLLMIHHLASGRWSFCLQRPYEAAARTFPLILVLFIPIAFGMDRLYAWVNPAKHHDHVLEHVMQHKGMYLNLPWFFIRTGIYFAIWIGLTWLLTTWSALQDARPAERELYGRKMRMLSGIGLVIFGLAVTFAAFDWAMSVEPKWYSSIYGAIMMVGQGVSTLCLMAIVARILSADSRYGSVIGVQQFHDIGNMIFAFTILWTYMNVSQLVIIWSGNLPEEIEYYAHRSHAPWTQIAAGLAVFHFFIPFGLMLFKAVKKNARTLSWIAGGLLVMRFVDYFWTLMPAFRHEHFHISWADLAAPIGMFGLWLFVFLGNLQKRPLLPLNDPRFAHILAHPEEHDTGWEADASDA
ncbi:MAG: hypothetical protein NZ740_08260 [Kiritimatiellae bacterium]|nr:hypothetical protein [Kiritimatiellia bacterium]MDW8459087.1 hypothetical protein [Verrucomicrobiota bacterium]